MPAIGGGAQQWENIQQGEASEGAYAGLNWNAKNDLVGLAQNNPTLIQEPSVMSALQKVSGGASAETIGNAAKFLTTYGALPEVINSHGNANRMGMGFWASAAQIARGVGNFAYKAAPVVLGVANTINPLERISELENQQVTNLLPENSSVRKFGSRVDADTNAAFQGEVAGTKDLFLGLQNMGVRALQTGIEYGTGTVEALMGDAAYHREFQDANQTMENLAYSPLHLWNMMSHMGVFIQSMNAKYGAAYTSGYILPNIVAAFFGGEGFSAASAATRVADAAQIIDRINALRTAGQALSESDLQAWSNAQRVLDGATAAATDASNVAAAKALVNEFDKAIQEGEQLTPKQAEAYDRAKEAIKEDFYKKAQIKGKKISYKVYSDAKAALERDMNLLRAENNLTPEAMESYRAALKQIDEDLAARKASGGMTRDEEIAQNKIYEQDRQELMRPLRRGMDKFVYTAAKPVAGTVSKGLHFLAKGSNTPKVMSFYASMGQAVQSDPRLAALWKKTQDGIAYDANGNPMGSFGENIARGLGMSAGNMFYSPASGVIDMYANYVATDPFAFFGSLGKTARSAEGFAGPLGKWFGGIGVRTGDDFFLKWQNSAQTVRMVNFMMEHDAQAINKAFPLMFDKSNVVMLRELGQAKTEYDVLKVFAEAADATGSTLRSIPTMSLWKLTKAGFDNPAWAKYGITAGFVGKVLPAEYAMLREVARDVQLKTDFMYDIEPKDIRAAAIQDSTLRSNASMYNYLNKAPSRWNLLYRFENFIVRQATARPMAFDDEMLKYVSDSFKPGNLNGVAAIQRLARITGQSAQFAEVLGNALIHTNNLNEWHNVIENMFGKSLEETFRASMPSTAYDSMLRPVMDTTREFLRAQIGLDGGGERAVYVDGVNGVSMNELVNPEDPTDTGFFGIDENHLGKINFFDARTLRGFRRQMLSAIGDTLKLGAGQLDAIKALGPEALEQAAIFKRASVRMALNSAMRTVPRRLEEVKSHEDDTRVEAFNSEVESIQAKVLKINKDKSINPVKKYVNAVQYIRDEMAAIESNLQDFEKLRAQRTLPLEIPGEIRTALGRYSALSEFERAFHMQIAGTRMSQEEIEQWAEREALDAFPRNPEAQRDLKDKTINQLTAMKRDYGNAYLNGWQKTVDRSNRFLSQTFVPMALYSGGWSLRVAMSEYMLNSFRLGPMPLFDAKLAASIAKHEYRGLPLQKVQKEVVDQSRLENVFGALNPDETIVLNPIGDDAPLSGYMVPISNEHTRTFDPRDFLGEPAVVPDASFYHGSANPWTDHKLSDVWQGKSADNLYGPGLYTTENKEIAREYTSKEFDPEKSVLNKTVYSLSWGADKPPVLIDLDKPITPEFRNVIQRWIEKIQEMSGKPRDEDFDGLVSNLENSLAEGHEGTNVYTEIKNSVAKFSSFYWDVPGIGGARDALLHMLRNDLQDAGYDGFSHIGGSIAGTTKHQVHIFFDTSKLKVQGHTVVEALTVTPNDRTAAILRRYYERNESRFRAPNMYMTAHYDRTTGLIHLDVARHVLDHDEAVAAGQTKNLRCVFDIENGRRIETGGTGNFADDSIPKGLRYVARADHEYSQAGSTVKTLDQLTPMRDVASIFENLVQPELLSKFESTPELNALVQSAVRIYKIVANAEESRDKDTVMDLIYEIEEQLENKEVLEPQFAANEEPLKELASYFHYFKPNTKEQEMAKELVISLISDRRGAEGEIIEKWNEMLSDLPWNQDEIPENYLEHGLQGIGRGNNYGFQTAAANARQRSEAYLNEANELQAKFDERVETAFDQAYPEYNESISKLRSAIEDAEKAAGGDPKRLKELEQELDDLDNNSDDYEEDEYYEELERIQSDIAKASAGVDVNAMLTKNRLKMELFRAEGGRRNALEQFESSNPQQEEIDQLKQSAAGQEQMAEAIESFLNGRANLTFARNKENEIEAVVAHKIGTGRLLDKSMAVVEKDTKMLKVVGSGSTNPRALAALQYELARFASEEEAGVSEKIRWPSSKSFHRSVGRRVTMADDSMWSADEAKQIARLDVKTPTIKPVSLDEYPYNNIASGTVKGGKRTIDEADFVKSNVARALDFVHGVVLNGSQGVRDIFAGALMGFDRALLSGMDEARMYRMLDDFTSATMRHGGHLPGGVHDSHDYIDPTLYNRASSEFTYGIENGVFVQHRTFRTPQFQTADNRNLATALHEKFQGVIASKLRLDIMKDLAEILRSDGRFINGGKFTKDELDEIKDQLEARALYRLNHVYDQGQLAQFRRNDWEMFDPAHRTSLDPTRTPDRQGPRADWAKALVESTVSYVHGPKEDGYIFLREFMAQMLSKKIAAPSQIAEQLVKMGESYPRQISARGFVDYNSMQSLSDGSFLNRISNYGHDKIFGRAVNALVREPIFLLEYHLQMEQLRELVDKNIIHLDQAEVMADVGAIKNMKKYVHNPLDRTNFENNMRVAAPFYFAQNQAWRRAFRVTEDDPGAFERYLKLCLGVTNYVAVNTKNGQSPSLSIPGSQFAMGFAAQMAEEFGTLFNPTEQSLFNNLGFGLSMDAGSVQSVVPTGAENGMGLLGDLFRPSWGPLVTLPLKAIGQLGYMSEHPQYEEFLKLFLGNISSGSGYFSDILPSTLVRDTVGAVFHTSAITSLQNDVMNSALDELRKQTMQRIEKEVNWTGVSADEKELLLSGATDLEMVKLEKTPQWNEIMDRARAASYGMYIAKMAIGFGAPAALSVQMQFSKDPAFQKLVNAVNADGTPTYTFAQAVTKWTQENPYNILDLVSKHQNPYGSFPEDNAFVDMWQKHPNAVLQYPALMAMIIPRNSTYNPGAFRILTKHNLAATDSPQDYINSVNTYLGNDWWYNFVEPVFYQKYGKWVGPGSAQNQISYQGWNIMKNYATWFGSNYDSVWYNNSSFGDTRKGRESLVVQQMNNFVNWSGAASVIGDQQLENLKLLNDAYNKFAEQVTAYELNGQNRLAFRLSTKWYDICQELAKSEQFSPYANLLTSVLAKIPTK